MHDCETEMGKTLTPDEDVRTMIIAVWKSYAKGSNRMNILDYFIELHL